MPSLGAECRRQHSNTALLRVSFQELVQTELPFLRATFSAAAGAPEIC